MRGIGAADGGDKGEGAEHGRPHRWGWRRERIGRDDGKAAVISLKMPELRRYGVVMPKGLVK